VELQGRVTCTSSYISSGEQKRGQAQKRGFKVKEGASGGYIRKKRKANSQSQTTFIHPSLRGDNREKGKRVLDGNE